MPTAKAGSRIFRNTCRKPAPLAPRSGRRSATARPFQLASRMMTPTIRPIAATRNVHSQPYSLRTDAASRLATKAPMLMPM